MIGRLFARLLSGGAMAAGGAPIWLWVIAVLIAALAGLDGLRRVQTSALKAEVATEREARSKDREVADRAAMVRAAAYAAESARRDREQAEKEAEGAKKLAAAQRDADDLRRVTLRLSQRLDAADAAARRAAADPGASDDCKATASASLLQSDMLRRAKDRLGALAQYADAARIAGQQCEASYDALKP